MQTRFKFICFFIVGIVCAPDIRSSTASQQIGSGPEEQHVESPPSDPLLCPMGAVQNVPGMATKVKEPAGELKVADEALSTAKEKHDAAREAAAQRARARALKKLNRTEEAAATWEAAAEAWERAGDGPGQVEALGEAALLLMSERSAASDQFFSRALELGKSEAKRPLSSAKCLHAIGSTAEQSRHLKEANAFLAAALSIREKLAPSSLETADTLNQLGFAVIRSDPNSARDYFSRALTLETALAPDSFEMADSLNGLGLVENTSGHLGSAREYLTRALNIRERLAPESMAVASALNSLGLVAIFQGDSAASKEYFLRFLAISEKLEPDSRAVTIGLMNLGNVAKEEGDFTAAQNYYVRTLVLQEKLFPNSDEMAGMLDNLGNVAFLLGDLSKAKEFYVRALGIQEKLGEQTDIALTLNALGNLAIEEGELGEAGKNLQRAASIQEKVAPEGLDIASYLNDLGTLSFRQQHIEESQTYHLRALKIQEKAGFQSLGLAATLDHLGNVARARGNWTAAKGYYRRALDIDEKALGPNHPDVARSLSGLADVLAASGETEAAGLAALRAEQIGREHLRLTTRSLPERQALLYASKRISSLNLLLTLAAERRYKNPSGARQAWDAVIRSRALILDEMAGRHRAVTQSNDPDVAHLAEDLSVARKRLANLVVRGLGDEPPERYRNVLDSARQKEEQAEHALAEKSFGFRMEQAKSRIGLEELADALPTGSSLVAFIRYDRIDLALNGSVGNPNAEAVPCYLAFVLQGKSDPIILPLGAAREIDMMVSRLREELTKQAADPGRSGKRTEVSYRSVGEVLRRKVWDPVAAQLGNTKLVFVVPDGTLHLVNLAALPTGRSGYLIETGPILHYLSAERDLVSIKSIRKGNGLLALGDPAFNDTKLYAAAAGKPERSLGVTSTQVAVSRAFRGSLSPCESFQSMRFEPLPGAAREVREIAALWEKDSNSNRKSKDPTAAQLSTANIVKLIGTEATEAEFKERAPGKRVLHLATHGFFLGERCPAGLERTTTENPLLLAGLALAGANHPRAAQPDEENGILTAEEIASLDLDGVEWAVLSACDTGAGEFRAGEGVLGLRRAFQVAGVQTLIMSLWPVEDEAARQWMAKLYDGRFLKKLDTAKAVHQASLGILSQRRERHQSTHPFYWAGFVAAGDWH